MTRIYASGVAAFPANSFVMARTTRTKRKWPGSPFWDRLVRITGEDDPGRLVYLTGLGYSQLTRYRSGEAGVRGPGAVDLERAVHSLRSNANVTLTMGQLWGSEPIEGIDDPTDEKFNWLVQRAKGLMGGTPEGPQPSPRSTRPSGRTQDRKG